MVDVTIPDEVTYITFDASGAGPHAFDFTYFAKTDLIIEIDGVELSQSDFTHTPNTAKDGGYDGGSVMLNSDVLGTSGTLRRQVVISRTDNYSPGPLPTQSISRDLARYVAMVQDVRRDIDRAVLAELGLTDINLPAAPASGSLFIKRKADGTLFGTTAEIEGVTPDASWPLENDFDASIFDRSFTPTGNTASRTLRTWGARDVRPEDFGAFGNGAANDTAALQAWLNAAASRDVKAIWPQKVYLLSEVGATLNVPAGVCIEAEGPNSILRRSVDVTQPVLYINSNADGVRVRGGGRIESTFGGTAASGSLNSGIGIYDADDVDIEDITVVGNFYTGVTFHTARTGRLKGARVRGVKNRGVYATYECLDLQFDDLFIDGQGVTEYGFNSNTQGSTAPHRLQIGRITVRDVTQHCVGLSGYYDHLSVDNIVTKLSSGAAVGTLLQLANTERGRKFNVGQINHDGDGMAVFCSEADDWVIGQIISENVNAGAHVYISKCKRWKLGGGSIIAGFQNGIYVTGTVAGDTTDGEICGFMVNGVGIGQGIYLVAANAGAVARMGVHHNRVLDCAAYGIIAGANTDRVDISHNIALTNTTAQIANSGTNAVTQDNIVT